MDKMMPSFGKLSEEADVISSCTSDSKPTNAVFQLREKYNALTSVIKVCHCPHTACHLFRKYCHDGYREYDLDFHSFMNFVALSFVQLVLDLFVHLTRVFSISLSPLPPLCRIELSRSWDPRPGMIFYLSFASFLGPYLSCSSLV